MLLHLSGYHKTEFVRFRGVSRLGKRQTIEPQVISYVALEVTKPDRGNTEE